MAYTKSKKKLAKRVADLPYEDVGAGLYDDETLITLDSGEEIAVSVAAERIAHTGGVVVIAWARWVNDDGSTRLDPTGQEMENEYRHSFPPEQVETIGVDALCRGVVKAMIGEDTEMAEVDLTDEVKRNVSIRHAIKVHKEVSAHRGAGDLL